MDHGATERASRMVLDADADGTGDGPFAVRLFHGTTHAFDAFESGVRGHADGAFGQMSYFTTSFDNAERHYARDLIDVHARIAIERRQLAPEEVAAHEARRLSELVGAHPRVVEAEVPIGRAFHLDGKSPLFDGGVHALADGTFATKEGALDQEGPLVFPGLPGSIARVRDEVAQEYGYDDEESFQDSGDDMFDDALYEMDEGEDRVVGKAQKRLDRAIARTIGAGMFAQGPAPEEMAQKVFQRLAPLDRLVHTQLYHALQAEGDGFAHAAGGGPAGARFASQVVRHLGFDAIVLHDADQRWPGFGMEAGTKHVHVFADREAEVAIVASYPVERADAGVSQDRGRAWMEKIHARAVALEDQGGPALPAVPAPTSRRERDGARA